MRREEALEFLELPGNATTPELITQYKEKYNFFQMLHSNAPNAVIRNIQQQNLLKLEEIRKDFIGDIPLSGSISIPAKEEPKPSIVSTVNTPAVKEISAWLIVHTENMTMRSFPLYHGENLIGRNPLPNINCIQLAQDAYVSRYHALIEVHPNQAIITDNGKYAGGKPSKNGTFINGNEHRLAGTRELREGDNIQVGYTKLIFKWHNRSVADLEQEVSKTEFIKTVVIDLF